MTDATETVGARPVRRRRGYFLPGAIALVALLVIGAAVGAGDLSHPAPRTLNGTDMASQIAFGVQEQQNTHTLPQVSCPAHEPVERGLQFRCSLSSGPGAPARSILVTEVDSRGNLRWAFAPAGTGATQK